MTSEEEEIVRILEFVSNVQFMCDLKAVNSYKLTDAFIFI